MCTHENMFRESALVAFGMEILPISSSYSLHHRFIVLRARFAWTMKEEVWIWTEHF